MILDWELLLKYPFNDKNWLRKMLIGTALSIIPIINVFTLGYCITCMRCGIMRRRRLPSWNNWDLFLQDGVWALVIAMAYLILPFIGAFFLSGIPFIGGFFSSLLILGMGLMIPFAWANYAVSRRMEDAFRFGELIKFIMRGQPAYTLMYIFAVFAFSLILILTAIMPLFFFISGALFFYLSVVTAYIFGVIYSRC